MLPKIIFSDFDGTLTDGEELGREFFDILDWAQQKAIPFIIVTGRSAQWAYFCLTHFEKLHYFIAEGGGVLVSRDPKTKHIATEFLVEAKEREALAQLTEKIQSSTKLSLSADSSGRLTDRAIELSDFENDRKLKEEVEAMILNHGGHHSSSSVHLNFWMGALSKSKAMDHCLEHFFKDVKKEEVLYFGDSLNDESVFRDYPWTVGVSNISKVLPKLKSRPKHLLEGHDKRGPYGVLNYLNSL